MVNYTTTKTRSTVYSNAKQNNDRRNKTIRECMETIDILVVDAAPNNRTEMQEIIEKVCPDIKEMLTYCTKIGLTINIGPKSIRVVVSRIDSFNNMERVKADIMKQYTSRIESSRQVNRALAHKKSENVM